MVDGAKPSINKIFFFFFVVFVVLAVDNVVVGVVDLLVLVVLLLSEGKPGISDVSTMYGISGLSFNYAFLSALLLF